MSSFHPCGHYVTAVHLAEVNCIERLDRRPLKHLTACLEARSVAWAVPGRVFGLHLLLLPAHV